MIIKRFLLPLLFPVLLNPAFSWSLFLWNQCASLTLWTCSTCKLRVKNVQSFQTKIVCFSLTFHLYKKFVQYRFRKCKFKNRYKKKRIHWARSKQKIECNANEALICRWTKHLGSSNSSSRSFLAAHHHSDTERLHCLQTCPNVCQDSTSILGTSG